MKLTDEQILKMAEERGSLTCEGYYKFGERRLLMFARAILAAHPVADTDAADPNSWQRAGSLLYRLTDELHPQNRDEIKVTMADGSRSNAQCEARAVQLLALLTGTPAADAAVTPSEPKRFDTVELILRDVCEDEPADPEQNDTVCINVSDLKIILDRHIAGRQTTADLLEWAIGRWNAEVANRPFVNVHRRALDGTWRQVIRRCGADDVALLGPKHGDLVAAAPATVAADTAAPSADARLGAFVRKLSAELADSPKSFLANVQRAIADLDTETRSQPDERAALSDVHVVECMSNADRAMRGCIFETPGARDIAWARALISEARAASQAGVTAPEAQRSEGGEP